jgi:hypothetical protein
MSRTPMAERAPRSSQMRGASTSAAEEIFQMRFAVKHRHCEERSDEAIHAAASGDVDCFASLAMTRRGSTDAGGEDIGYFVHWKKRVRIPPLTHALWRCPGKGGHAPQRRLSATRTCDASLRPISPVPQRAFCRCEQHWHGGGEDVCYFGRAPACFGGPEVAGSNPAG